MEWRREGEEREGEEERKRRKKEYDGDKRMMCFFSWCEIRRVVEVGMEGKAQVWCTSMVWFYGMSQKGNFDRKMIIIIIIINNQCQSKLSKWSRVGRFTYSYCHDSVYWHWLKQEWYGETLKCGVKAIMSCIQLP